jgi:hypothetical protein
MSSAAATPVRVVKVGKPVSAGASHSSSNTGSYLTHLANKAVCVGLDNGSWVLIGFRGEDLGFDILGSTGLARILFRSALIRVIAHVGNGSRNRRCRGHGGTHQVSASSIALSPFKVTVTCTSTPLLRFQLVIIHGQTHAASRFAPIKACLPRSRSCPSLLLRPAS